MIPSLLPFSLCFAAAPGGFCVFVADSSGGSSVRECTTDSANYSVDPQLSGITLLECVPVCRTPLDESFYGRALLRTDLEQGTRVQLPNGAGSVYHYLRGSGDTTSYGFFSIDAQGDAHVLIELPAGPGPSDPFLSSVAAKPSGSSMLVATQPIAGGDLWQLYTDGSAPVDRTASVPMQVFGRDSFFLSSELGIAVSTTGVLRFDPGEDDCADFVGFGPESVPAWLGLELMPSANGRYAVFLGGDGQDLARPFVAGTCGNAVAMSDAAMLVTGAGFLPESVNGPWLAVSDDGAQCAWRVGQGHTTNYSHELFIARRDAGAPLQTLHLTQDSIFEPYIDEIGLAFYRPGGTLVFAGGDAGQSQAMLSRADVFCANFQSSGALSVTNLSLTSGDPAPPFLNYGALELFRVRVRSSSGRVLLYSREASTHRLFELDLDTFGVQLLEDGVEELGLTDTASGDWVVAMEVPGHGHHTGLSRIEVGSEIEIETPLELPNLGGATRMLRSAFDHDCYACIVDEGASEHAWQVDIATGAKRTFSARGFQFGRSMAFADDGSLVLSLDTAGGQSLFVVWPPLSGPPAVAHMLWLMPESGFVLPGA